MNDAVIGVTFSLPPINNEKEILEAIEALQLKFKNEYNDLTSETNDKSVLLKNQDLAIVIKVNSASKLRLNDLKDTILKKNPLLHAAFEELITKAQMDILNSSTTTEMELKKSFMIALLEGKLEEKTIKENPILSSFIQGVIDALSDSKSMIITITIFDFELFDYFSRKKLEEKVANFDF